MIFIIPEREILKAVTDRNINSPSAKLRVKAFGEAHDLIAYQGKPVMVVIEGNLYEKVSERLEEEHELVFNNSYEIDNSALNLPNYDFTKGIKFIIKEKKLPIKRNKIIILTDNTSNYPEYEQCQNPRVRVLNPSAFLEKIKKFEKIKSNYDEVEDALVTAFFID